MFDSPKAFFNHLCTVSRDDGFPSYGERPGGGRNDCLYRGPNGRKCPAGHCIPDANYDTSLEGRDAMFVCFMGRLDLPPGVSDRELYKAQVAHDGQGRYSNNADFKWSHDLFVTELLKIPCFAGLTDPTAAAVSAGSDL